MGLTTLIFQNYFAASALFCTFARVTTTLYLTRHGQTEDNLNQIMQGQTQGRLTPLGEEQARQLGVALRGVCFQAVVSSDLWRARHTAELAMAGRALAVETTPLLRERDWGGFTGRYIPSLKHEAWPDDVESAEALLERAACFLAWVRSRYEGKTVLAVAHGIINKAIQSVYYGKPMREILPMGNCEVRVLQL